MPYPIASAWHRYHLATSEADRLRQLEAALEIALRTLSALLLPDYLRGEAAEAVERALSNLKRPSMGHWLELVRELSRHLRSRTEPVPFLEPAGRWMFDEHGGPAKTARLLNEAVTLRNRYVHGAAPLSPGQETGRREALHEKVHLVLESLSWLCGYRLFRLRSVEPTHRRTDAGKIQLFVGEHEFGDDVWAEWDRETSLLLGPVYLLNPAGDSVLELSPFLQVLSDPRTGQERLFVFKAVPDSRSVQLAHDESGAEVSTKVRFEGKEEPFDEWLKHRPGLRLFQSIRHGSESLKNQLETGGDHQKAVAGGRYELGEEIGRGGMSVVFRAHDREGDEDVALKILDSEFSEDSAFRLRFDREWKTMRRLHHQGIVPVLDAGTLVDGRLFLAMPLLAAGSLREKLKPGGLPQDAVTAWAVQALEALNYLHGEKIIHRDIKPANFLLDKSGRVLLADFGIAKRLDEDSRLTRTLEQVGTVAYMAPEQRRGLELTAKSDIYSLALVLHEVLTGQMPEGRPGKGVPGSFGEALRRMGSEEPDDRPAAQEALDIIKGLERTEVTCAGPLVTGVGSGGRSKRLFVVAAVSITVLATVAGILWIAQIGRHAASSSSPKTAQTQTSSTKRKSVAVLGFRNLGKPEDVWIGTALAEMFRTEMAAGQSIRAIPGETVARTIRDLDIKTLESLSEETVSKVRLILGADYVLSGTYLVMAGGGEATLRVDLHLEDTAHHEVVGSTALTGTASSLFTLVSQGGTALREKLGLEARSEGESGGIRAAMPQNEQAARYYADGLEKLRIFDVKGASVLLEKAAHADPSHPLIWAAQARAWSDLGYDARARNAGKKALDLAGSLSREDRLGVEGLYFRTTGEWSRAVEIYKSLSVFYPDSLEYALQLVDIQVAAGDGSAALATVTALRSAGRGQNDPRIDLAEARAAKALTDFPRQQKAAAAAAALSKAQGSRLLFASARLSEGDALVQLGKALEGVEACEEARSTFEIAGDRASAAQAANTAAVAFARERKPERALERFRLALATYKEVGNQRGIAATLTNIGNVFADRGDYPAAREAFQGAVEACREAGDRIGEGRALNNLGTADFETKQYDGALRRYKEALVLFMDVGSVSWIAITRFNIGEVLLATGKTLEAERAFGESAAGHREAGQALDEGDALAGQAKALIALGRNERALAILEEAKSAYRTAEDPDGEAAVAKIQSELRAK